MKKARASRSFRRAKQGVPSGFVRGLFGDASVMTEETPKKVRGNGEGSTVLVTCWHYVERRDKPTFPH